MLEQHQHYKRVLKGPIFNHYIMKVLQILEQLEQYKALLEIEQQKEIR